MTDGSLGPDGSRGPDAASRTDAPGDLAGGVRVPGGVPAPGGSTGPAGGVLVIGYGNTLRSDDGVGRHAAALLAEDPRLAGAEVVACHQLTPELALDIGRASVVIFVDASTDMAAGAVAVRRLDSGDAVGPAPQAAGAAGTGQTVDAGAATDATGIRRAAGAPRVAAADGGPSSHHVGSRLLLELAGSLYDAAPAAFEVGVGVASLEVGEELSPPVAAALPTVADVVAGLVADVRASDR